jgi:hypothetical protein
MERLKHICVADGSAFANGNIPGATQLELPDIYVFAKNKRQQLGAVEFGLVVGRIATDCGYPFEMPEAVRTAIQGGVVCAVAGCEVAIPRQRTVPTELAST